MTLSAGSDTDWSRLSTFVAGAMGLHFPRERWPDLRRGLTGAAREFGFDDVAACADWLLGSPPNRAQLQVLASHLTIGETYFFRDKHTLSALSGHVLPGLIRARRGREQRLRLWSAACCSGEEPYTLAILLHQLLPDLADWHVTIRATDINPHFLHKADAGVYGEWSFRDAPVGLKDDYFSRTADGRYAVIPEIKALVSFTHLNLVEDVYPSPVTDTNAMDLIFCRNVLMYFTPPQIEKAVGKLRHALVDDGWLVVSPSEASHALFSRFARARFPDAILYQKSGAPPPAEPQGTPALPAETVWFSEAGSDTSPPWAPAVLPAHEPPEPAKTSPAPYAAAALSYQQGRYAEAADILASSFSQGEPDAQAFSLLVRALANLGKLADALTWCNRWVAADKVDPAGHYLRAVVLLEHGDPEQARLSLQRALFLRPDFVLAHFALGNLARGRARNAEADKHFANALAALRRHEPDDLLPDSDGLSAGRLTEIINTMTTPENTS